ncbi:hypothetical protein GCM10023185_30200 [Hymenobacter saemangeumensis]|uniref:5'-Nucleotidase C-terminal domain-containing protein n=1 Tax=Hymenobacter saemangeumensis TaxID=1084522 RepID=A0ABP8ILE7_9BACT
MRFRQIPALALSALLLLGACQRGSYVPSAKFAPSTSQNVGKAQPEDPAVAALIVPYREKVTSQMREVLGTAPLPLAKTPGENPLANFVSDLQRSSASQALGERVDLGVMSNGGLRTALPAGPITMGSVFELMPFENELVVLDASGDVVQQLFEYAARIKMGVSGATYAVGTDGKPRDIRIGGQVFNPSQDRMWTIAISDYLAGGGDNMVFFKSIKPRPTSLLLRNAIADHIRQLTKEGKQVEARIDGRVKGN